PYQARSRYDCGSPQRRIGPRHIEQCAQTGETEEVGEERREGVTMYRFLIIIEKANGNFSAYPPDLPGCAATGKTRQQATRNMHSAIEMHVRAMLEDKL